jgi:dephospho-CoA kinase
MQQSRIEPAPTNTRDDSVIDDRPSWWFAIVPKLAALLVACMLLGSWVGVRVLWPDSNPRYLFVAGVAVIILEFAHDALVTLLYRYRATRTHASSVIGILSRRRSEIPLARIVHVRVRQTFLQRLLKCGTIDLAAPDGVPVSWPWIDQPERLAAVLRDLIDRANNNNNSNNNDTLAPSPSHRVTVSPSHPPPTMKTPDFKTLGLVGGIGAGKSAVANILADLGYLVLDADKDAKAALDRPDVRGFLISWWGSQIVGADGKVDRRRVGDIVFANPEERRKLEALVHPIVRADRSAHIDAARQSGKPGVVVDAPLLFEAGSDKDCDAVLFVDAPREARLQRVLARGWTPDELDKREAAQLPLAEKRRRSTAVIVNDRDLTTLRERVQEAIARIA